LEENKGRLLGIDHGTKRIGLALSDPTRTIASPVGIIENDSRAIDRIIEIAKSSDCEYVVLGVPDRSNIPHQKKVIEKFALELSAASGLKIVMEIEDMSSHIAEQAMIEADMSRAKRKKKLDSVAAVIILQRHLDALVIRKRNAPKAE
jgi:putative holliday junction resolvase